MPLAVLRGYPMSGVRQSKNSQREFITRLKSESASLGVIIEAQAAELAANKEKKSNLDATIASYEGPKVSRTPKATNLRVPRVSPPNIEDVVHNGVFHGLSLQEAARKQLEITHRAQTAQEIWPVLSAAGFISASERPSNAVHWALRKRQKLHGDVMLVGGGQWGLPDWYNEQERAEIGKNLGGMAGRNRKTHSEKTKLGMELSRRRGVRIGAQVKVTDEVIKNLQKHIAEGDSIRAACMKEKISAGSFYLLRKGPKQIPGLEPLHGEARRRAIQKAKAKAEPMAPDLLTTHTDGRLN